jgi:hypothetical protein
MTDAAVALPRSPIYGLASCRVGNEYLDFEIGWREFERDTAWAESILRRAGLTRGDMALTTLTNWESPWGSPVVHALRNIGVTYLPAEVFAWDVRRVLMFLQRFPVKAIVGLGGQTLTALTEAGAPVTELLSGVDVIWARPRAAVMLGEHRAVVAPFVRFGPALAMGLPGQTHALLNAREWDVAATERGLLVSGVAPRATTFRDVATGFRGTAVRIEDEIAVSGEPVS